MNRYIKIFVGTMLFLAIGLPLLAEQELSLSRLTEKALGYLPELKQASCDIRVAQSVLHEHVAANSLQLRLKATSEYTRDFSSGSNLVAINNSTLGSSTQFQDSFGLSLTVPLYYYDLVELKRAYDERDLESKTLAHRRLVRNIKLWVLNTYTDVLLNYRERQVKLKVLGYCREMFGAKQRLNSAGAISRVDISDQAVQIAGLLNDLDDLDQKLAAGLGDLSRLTGEPYRFDQVRLAPLDATAIKAPAPTQNFDLDLDYRLAQLEIDKKNQELQLEMKGNWPKLDGYAQYVWYGASPDNYLTAVRQITGLNLNVGISSTFTLYDGFYNTARIERLKAELESLELKKEQQRLNRIVESDKLHLLLAAWQKKRLTDEEQAKRMAEKVGLIDRLSQEKIADSLQSVQVKIDNVLVAFEREKKKINDLKAIQQQWILVEDNSCIPD